MDSRSTHADHAVAGLFPQLPRPACRVVLVVGAPGSGKSHWVAQQAAADETVIDLDVIVSELSGEPLYRARRDVWIQRAIDERNRRLALLATMTRDERAFFVVCAPGTQFTWWRRALLPAAVQRLATPQWQAEENIRRDPRRSHDLQRHLAACADWYERNGAALRAALSRV